MEDEAQLFAQAVEYQHQMRLEKASGLFSLAEAAGYSPAACKAARWTCHMLAGNWAQAWRESDGIAELGNPDPHCYWDGSDWSGKNVLVRCLHGLGDTLQFIRYCSLIRKRARTLTIEAQPKLKTLLQRSHLADQVIAWGEIEPAWEVQMEVNELPRIFRTVVETVPDCVPYLHANRRPSAIRDRLQVGLIWAASNFDLSRNVPFSLLRTLFDLPKITYCSLQAGDGWTESLPQGIVRRSGRDTPIEQIAGEMMDLDVVLTVDTMNAHLAGALGRNTWTMLPFRCDWRWMKDGKKTPWYPTMRLFRQPSPDDWETVVAEVREALRTIQQQRSLRQPAG